MYLRVTTSICIFLSRNQSFSSFHCRNAEICCTFACRNHLRRRSPALPPPFIHHSFRLAYRYASILVAQTTALIQCPGFIGDSLKQGLINIRLGSWFTTSDKHKAEIQIADLAFLPCQVWKRIHNVHPFDVNLTSVRRIYQTQKKRFFPGFFQKIISRFLKELATEISLKFSSWYFIVDFILIFV